MTDPFRGPAPEPYEASMWPRYWDSALEEDQSIIRGANRVNLRDLGIWRLCLSAAELCDAIRRKVESK